MSIFLALLSCISKGLGTYIGETSTKAAVMAVANHGTIPSFSKYSGTVEWKNAIFLWINYRAPSNEVQNEFSRGGRCINWFGGSQVYADSPIIQKLIEYSDATPCAVDSEVTLSGSPCVVLFLRCPKEKYICLGRVKYEAHDLDVHPVQFIWSFVDFGRLASRIEFQELLSM